jgi:outer membrane cobalamin receptor
MFSRQYWCAQSFLLHCSAFILVSFVMQGSVLRAIGQESAANIVGTTTDTKGVAVPFACVTITNNTTGLERQTTSDKEGNFVLPALPPGVYTLTAQSASFPRMRLAGLQLQAGVNSRVSMQFPAVVTLRGSVKDFKTLEPIAKALVSIRDQNLKTITDNAGHFELTGVQPGEVEVYITTVGYGLLKTTLQIPADVDSDVDLQIGQEALKRNDQVTVSAGPYDRLEPEAPTEQVLQASELKNLSSMFGDSFRSIHSLPGVAAPDDYYADFAYRGAGIPNIAFYLDGVLLKNPFHDNKQITGLGSVSLLNGDIIESLSLLGGGFPARYGDSTGAVLNIQTREPDNEKVAFRINMDCFQGGATAEGPLGRSKKAAWLVTARKSYLQYLMNRLGTAGLSIGYYDTEDKLSWDPSSHHHINLMLINGDANLNQSFTGPADVVKEQSPVNILNMSWQWTPRSSASMRTTLSYNSETDHNQMDSGDLLRSPTKNYAFRHDDTIQFTKQFSMEAGAEARDARENYLSNYVWDVLTERPLVTPYPLGKFDQQTWLYGAYAQPSWSALRGRILLTAGGRYGRLDYTNQEVLLPRASASFGVASRTRISAGYGQYAQFPEFEQLLGDFNSPALRAERSTHYILGLEQQFSERIRLKVDLYDRKENQLPYSPETEWRLVNGVATLPVYGTVLTNSTRGYSRGMEITLQRVSANRLSGWLSYSLGHTRYCDALASLCFDGDFDQRHIGTAFASYRFNPTVNLSGKFNYESNFPVVGFFQGNPAASDQTQYFTLSDQRNQMRVPAYSRLDTRLNKAYFYKRSKLTVDLEIDNMLDHKNWRYYGLKQYDFSTGEAWMRRDNMLPVLPSAGFTLEF